VPLPAGADEAAAGGQGHEHVAGGAAGEGDDVVPAVAVEVPRQRHLGAEAEVRSEVRPDGDEAAAGGQGHEYVAAGAAREGEDVVIAVAVEVARQRHLGAGAEGVVPLPAGAEETAAGGQGHVDVAGGAAVEGDDVVPAVAVEVPRQRLLGAEAEV